MDSKVKHTFVVDASYNLQRKVTGIGIVIHETDRPNRNGKIIDEISELYSNIPSNDSEKFAVLRALEIARSRNYRIVHVFTDYNYLKKQLRAAQERKISTNGDLLLEKILQLINNFQEIEFKYKMRRKNQTAHRLAKKAVDDSLPKSHLVYLNP